MAAESMMDPPSPPQSRGMSRQRSFGENDDAMVIEEEVAKVRRRH